MKEFLMNISKELKNFSLSLKKTSILINKPWALLDDDNEIQKLIFKKNKDLILSKNGKVQMGRWDYFPEAKSLLIDRKSDTILCNEEFINEGVLILRMDGTKRKYFTLSNENIIPDLDPIRYLKELKKKKFNIREYELEDGGFIEIHLSANYVNPSIGDKVVVPDVEKADGFFKLAEPEKHLLVIRNTFSHLFTEKKYKDIEGQEIQIIQRWEGFFQMGDSVSRNNEILKEEEINLSNKIKLILQDGKITKIKRKYLNLFWF